MRKSRFLLLPLLCLALILGSGCQRKGIPCPKPSGKRSKVQVQGPDGKGFESIRVQTDKNGRVKKRRFL